MPLHNIRGFNSPDISFAFASAGKQFWTLFLEVAASRQSNPGSSTAPGITPLFTTTPRLEQEFRSDITWSPNTTGNDMNYGSGKGLELIPTEHIEIIAGVPPYQAPAVGQNGFGNIPLTMSTDSWPATRSTATTL